jgi:hypothetical protein
MNPKKSFSVTMALLIASLVISLVPALGQVETVQTDHSRYFPRHASGDHVSSNPDVTKRGIFSIVQFSICMCGEQAKLNYGGALVCWLTGLSMGDLLLYRNKYVEVTGYPIDCLLCYVIMVENITELPLCGNANGDNVVDVDDVVYLINYQFAGGPAPVPVTCGGDANGDGKVNASDVVYLINYLFIGGPAPQGCCG